MEQRPPNSISNLLCRRPYTHRQIIANNISFENNFVFVFWRPYTLGELYDMDENCCLWMECYWKWMKIVKHWMNMYLMSSKSKICIFQMPCPKWSLFFFSLVFQQWMKFSIYNSGLSGHWTTLDIVSQLLKKSPPSSFPFLMADFDNSSKQCAFPVPVKSCNSWFCYTSCEINN